MKGFSKAISLGITCIQRKGSSVGRRPKVHMQPIRLASLAGIRAGDGLGRMIESEDLSQSLFYCISVAE